MSPAVKIPLMLCVSAGLAMIDRSANFMQKDSMSKKPPSCDSLTYTDPYILANQKKRRFVDTFQTCSKADGACYERHGCDVDVTLDHIKSLVAFAP
jgi:hypothetical protein